MTQAKNLNVPDMPEAKLPLRIVINVDLSPYKDRKVYALLCELKDRINQSSQSFRWTDKYEDMLEHFWYLLEREDARIEAEENDKAHEARMAHYRANKERLDEEQAEREYDDRAAQPYPFYPDMTGDYGWEDVG